MSDGYWTARFERDPGDSGTDVVVNGTPITIVGITAPDFEGVESGVVDRLLDPAAESCGAECVGDPPENGKTLHLQCQWWCLHLIGRLAPGVTQHKPWRNCNRYFRPRRMSASAIPGKARSRPTLSVVAAKSFPGSEHSYGQPLRMLMTMVGLVLLIALSNVGHAADGAECDAAAGVRCAVALGADGTQSCCGNC